MEIIVDKARKKEESHVSVPKQQTVSARIKKSFPTCTLREALFPKQYEEVTLLFYLLIAPLILGHLFLFTYVSRFNFSIYSSVTAKNHLFLNWCIGYEILAILVFILLTLFSLRNASNL